MKAYEVQNFTLDDQVVKAIHNLLDRSGPVPPMHVKDVDVTCPELSQAGFNASDQRLRAVAYE